MSEKTLTTGKALPPKKSSGSIRFSDNKRKKTSANTFSSAQNKRKAYSAARNISSNGASSIRAVPSNTSSVKSKAVHTEKTKTKTRWVRSGFDYPLFTIVLILLAFGLIMMFSASYAVAYTTTGDSLFYLKKQATFAVIGLSAMIIASNVDYHIFGKKPIPFILFGVSLFFMVMVKLVGSTENGSERWLAIGSIKFQPSEILKFAVIVIFAYMIEKKYRHLKELKKGYMPFMVVLALSCISLIAQPHLSGTIIVFAIGIAMMFVGGLNSKHLIVTIVLMIPAVILGIAFLKQIGYDYFDARIISFIDPEADIQNDTFQTYQSLVTIGSGGLFGLGFGNSRQKYAYLPEARNDFIFPIICEELGFVGAALVILLFVLLIWRGFYIAIKARDKFGMMLAFGITFQIGLQALLNIAVVTNSVPNTGISLPFFSYGGTALLMQLGEMGILLNVSRKAALK